MATDKVIIIEDSKVVRLSCQKTLAAAGFEANTYSSALEALSEITREFSGIVISDVNMPEMDGEELIRHIRERSSQQSVPILMVTSEGDQSRISAVQQAGVSGICDKPFETLTIKTLIRQMMTEF